MIKIIFESHCTTFENEAGRVSGHIDAELSPLGRKQAKELGKRYENDHFDAIFCSDLQRSYLSAGIAFGDKWPIIKDKRLRECDFGDMTLHPEEEVDKEKIQHITLPFSKGESYEQVADRMRSFLEFLLTNYEGKKIMIIGHRATHYGLEHWVRKLPLKEIVSFPWNWQPGWVYEFNTI